MDNRMIRFLNSIGIEEHERFDLAFDSIVKSQFERNHYIYNIHKKSPWTYEDLDIFLNGLMNIHNYTYEINFIYDDEIKNEDVISLTSDFLFNKFGIVTPLKLDLESGVVYIELKNDKANEDLIKNELKSFFKFINYNYSFDVKTINEEKLNKKSDDEFKKEEFIENQKIEEEEAKVVAVNNLKENYERMLEERKNENLFKKGGYEYTLIKDIDTNSDAVDFNGFIYEVDIRETKKGGLLAKIGVSDNKTPDAINVTIISNNSSLKQEDFKELVAGRNIRIKGKVGIDKFKHDIYVMCHYFSMLPDTPLREDHASEKRVELHLHSKMSEMDAVSSISDYCALAKNMGHKAIAITDHGVVQAFPEAQQAAKKYGIKMLYGSELYVIDDYIKGAVNPEPIDLNAATYVCFDLESTGLSIKYDSITEFGAVKVKNGLVVDRLDILIKPAVPIPHKLEIKTHITNEMVKDKPSIKEVIPQILEFFKDSIIISHNIEFDYGLLNEEMVKNGFGKLKFPAIDTLALSRFIYPESRGHSLGNLSKRLEVFYDEESAHRADYDAEVLSSCWISMRNILLKKDNIKLHKDLAELPIEKSALRHFNRGIHHVCVLAKNRAGLKDLYKIISISHVDYMGQTPLVPERILNQFRKNLIVGSACLNGDVFYSSTNRNMETLEKVISKYDYIEIQPLENYRILLDTDEIHSEEMLKKYLMDIINTAKKLNKPIVATSDCHYCNREQHKYREIYIYFGGVGGTLHPLFTRTRREMLKEGKVIESPYQYYLSTEEMLEAFSWLKDEEFIKEIVIKNTNKIADMCEEIIPIPDKLFTPTIDNCENLLRDLCYTTARKVYGDIDDPKDEAKVFIKNRLETELDGIISNGFSVIYYIAHKLVKKSNDDGYLVGSRGSVGSSLAATMSGITEVNPLPPHYVCPHCHKTIFYKGNDIKSGFDLPNMKCPDCGTEMNRNGQNIPFQTFLGFKAEKVPDIDLNFPTDYQAKAHLYTKVLLGEDKVYRAGTISTVQFKTAYGYVKKYYEKLGIDPNTVKSTTISSLAYGCQEVKRTTGQHPGGIVVIPRDYDVYDFTPVQYPAGDVEAAWKTTHYDFHAIHDTILKLDMLGHVDPQALKMMSDLTGVDCRTIPLDDRNVISLFSTDKCLHLKHKYLKEDNGALALPEFGTPFVRQMLRETLPSTFSDLLIISGLSHGTNVWNNNAQELIQNKITDLRGVIGCRDDIMSFLISKGIEGHEAFLIMETVRKGKKLAPETITLMKEHNVPDYYIESCKKIKYLFPKGHACAYVMMALRVGYYKIYYPLEFYATFFTLRCDQYDLETMRGGIDAIYNKLEEYANRRKSSNPELKLSPKEEEIEKTLQVALEFAERGYVFLNLDIEKSDSKNFIVDKEHNALIPPFKVLDGLGDTASESLIKARKEKPFTSQEDLLNRGKITKTTLKQLKELGVLNGLSETGQMQLFDINLF